MYITIDLYSDIVMDCPRQRLIEPPWLIFSPDLRPEVAACSFSIPKPNVMVSLGRLWPRAQGMILIIVYWLSYDLDFSTA